MIFKSLLQEVTYKILLFLTIMQKQFQYCWYYRVKLYLIYLLFFLYADQFLLTLIQILGLNRFFILDQVKSFFLKEFDQLQCFY